MQKCVSIRPEVYAQLGETFDDYENGMYMSYADGRRATATTNRRAAR